MLKASRYDIATLRHSCLRLADLRGRCTAGDEGLVFKNDAEQAPWPENTVVSGLAKYGGSACAFKRIMAGQRA